MTWLSIIGIALLIDIVIGERLAFFSKKLIQLVHRPADFFEGRLNRRERSYRDLQVRGGVVAFLLTALTIALGLFLNTIISAIPGGNIVAAIVLVPFIGQKDVWVAVGTPISQSPSETDHHHHIHERCIAVIERFGTSSLPASFLFILGGFSLFLPYIIVRTVAHEVDTGTHKSGPYYVVSRLAATLLSLPSTLFAVLSLLLARFFMPGTQLNPIKGMGRNQSKLASFHYWPVNIVAHGLYLSFKHPVLCYKKRRLKREAEWIGPRDGKARITALHLKRVWNMVLIANAFCLLAGIMVYTALAITMA